LSRVFSSFYTNCYRLYHSKVTDPLQKLTQIPRGSKAGLRSAFGFPIRASGQVVGIMTFFCREKQPSDEDLLQMMAAVGSQLGQFVKRKYAEKELQEAEASIRFLYEQEKRQSEKLAQQNLALEQAKLELEAANQELHRLASVDGLTQIANRRSFD